MDYGLGTEFGYTVSKLDEWLITDSLSIKQKESNYYCLYLRIWGGDAAAEVRGHGAL